MSSLSSVRQLLTTRRVLGLGFGFLLTLLALSGVNAIRVLNQLRTHNESIVEDFAERVQHLDEIRSTVYLSGTYIRDYLLEPDPEQAEPNRSALRDAQVRIRTLLSERHSADAAERELYGALARETQDYFRAPEPVLSWNAQQRQANGYRFFMTRFCPAVPAPCGSRT
jgi:hypothetical protein